MALVLADVDRADNPVHVVLVVDLVERAAAFLGGGPVIATGQALRPTPA